MTETTRPDPHSFYEEGQPRVTSLDWHIGDFNFTEMRMPGIAIWTFDGSGPTHLDMRGLEIIAIKDSHGDYLEYAVSEPVAVLGQRLTITVPEDKQVQILYRTSPDASGLQWMDADIAEGQPFVYTQGEAINARSYIPCQDTPSIKFTFGASITVPFGMRGLIAAAEHKTIVRQGNDTSTETWNMPYPVPSYLLAFAAGNLVSADISERSRVWAQPSLVEAAAHEFADIPKLMAAGEELFGVYPFGRYDVLVMPAAFPYGGMENPCCSFLTPSLITGDGSGLSTVAHELAHSWTGNLVTNADWDAFWLNEGWTVWAEEKIVAAVYGQDAADTNSRLLQREYELDAQNFREEGKFFLTALAHGYNEVDPDDVFSRGPYHKGKEFLRCLESLVGPSFQEKFVPKYLETYRFRSLTTGEFFRFACDELGVEVMNAAKATDWLYEPGIPSTAVKNSSAVVKRVEDLARLRAIPTGGEWTTSMQQLYLELLPRPLSPMMLKSLEDRFDPGNSPSIEVRWSYLMACIESEHFIVLTAVEHLLRGTGRMKYLKPLYRALTKTEQGRAFAERVFAEAKSSYHPVAVAAVEAVLA